MNSALRQFHREYDLAACDTLMGYFIARLVLSRSEDDPPVWSLDSGQVCKVCAGLLDDRSVKPKRMLGFANSLTTLPEQWKRHLGNLVSITTEEWITRHEPPAPPEPKMGTLRFWMSETIVHKVDVRYDTARGNPFKDADLYDELAGRALDRRSDRTVDHCEEVTITETEYVPDPDTSHDH